MPCSCLLLPILPAVTLILPSPGVTAFDPAGLANDVLRHIDRDVARIGVDDRADAHITGRAIVPALTAPVILLLFSAEIRKQCIDASTAAKMLSPGQHLCRYFR
jgi:hypothetical protein